MNYLLCSPSFCPHPLSVNFQWGKTLPVMNVTLAPYAFSSLDVWRKWPDSKAAAFLSEKLLQKGVRNVAWLFQTNSSVFTSKGKALIKPEDFKGVKIRGLNPSFDASLSALGAATVSMPGSEVYQSLATGVLDAGMTDIAAAVSRKYYEAQDHMTVVPAISVYFHGYVNPAFYNSLSDKSKAAPAELEAKGVTVHVATARKDKARNHQTSTLATPSKRSLT